MQVDLADYNKASRVENNSISYLPEKPKEDQLRVFPNPAGNYFKIEFTNPDYQTEGILNLFDIIGKLITTVKVDKWQKSITISTQNLTQGVYLVRYTDQYDRIISKKLIISK